MYIYLFLCSDVPGRRKRGWTCSNCSTSYATSADLLDHVCSEVVQSKTKEKKMKLRNKRSIMSNVKPPFIDINNEKSSCDAINDSGCIVSNALPEMSQEAGMDTGGEGNANAAGGNASNEEHDPGKEIENAMKFITDDRIIELKTEHSGEEPHPVNTATVSKNNDMVSMNTDPISIKQCVKKKRAKGKRKKKVFLIILSFLIFHIFSGVLFTIFTRVLFDNFNFNDNTFTLVKRNLVKEIER